MPLRAPLAATITTAFLLVAPGAATAASAGETFLAGGLELPAGAIPAGPGGERDGEPTRVSLSADGRYVAFAADADALSAEQPLDVTGIFRKDRVTGAVTLVSRADGQAGAPAGENGELPAISDDGRRVAWRTAAALDPADVDGGRWDVYVRDLDAGTTTLASQGDGGLQTALNTGDFDLSGDGAHVAFTTADALAGADDGNGVLDVYRRDLAAGTTRLVSATPAGLAGNAASYEPSLTRDGAYVAYASRATDLNAGFTDRNGGGNADVWLRTTGARTQTLVSRRAFGGNEGGAGESTTPHVTNPTVGALYVAYMSAATDVAQAGVDASTTRSVYRRALFQPYSTLVSRAGGANADRTAFARGISADGARIVFDTPATNLGAPAGLSNATYLHDVDADTTTHLSGEAYEAEHGGISADGTVVAWASSHGVTADSELELPGVFARPLGGTLEYVSRPEGGVPLRAPAFSVQERDSTPRFSADGRYVVFSSASRHLPGATGGIGDEIAQVYRRDLATGAIELVSRADGPDGAPSGAGAYEASVSADGTRVAFTTEASLSPADGDAVASVYVRDLAAQTTILVSRADGFDGAVADASAYSGGLSADGRHVAFATAAANLGVPSSTTHLFVRDLAAGRTQLVDRADGSGGDVGDDYVTGASISGDGRLVAFASRARNLVADDADGEADVFVRDVVAGTTSLISRRADGTPTALEVHDPAISADGRTVAFSALDEQLAPEGGAWSGRRQVVARDLVTGANRLVSRAPGDGQAADAAAGQPSISADGTRIAFESVATNLLPGRGGADRPAVFARDLTTGALAGPPAFGRVANAPVNGARSPGISPDGRCLGVIARGHNAATGAAGDLLTLYVHALSDDCAAAAPGGGGVGGGGGGGEGGGAGAGGGSPSAPSLSAPRVTGVSLAAKRFRVARGATARVAATRGPRARRPRVPAGTTFRFGLSAAADVTIAFERKAAGRKVGKACRRPARRLRKRPRCTRWVAAGALTRRQLGAGRRDVAFSGRIGRRALARGAYRATIAARNAAGRSAPVRLAFTVVRG